MNVKDWIINWFESNSDLSKEDIKNNLNVDYLAEGWVDSFKFVSFITELEDTFKITFSNDEFQNKAFSTINGLTKIIEGRIEK